MDRQEFLRWIRDGLRKLRDDVYLLENDVSERCISAKFGGYLQQLLPSLLGEAHAKLPAGERHHVDCEFNRLGGDRKWIRWKSEVYGELEVEPYYTPIPDIILHRRGVQGPNRLVIEIKKQSGANDFTALIDRLKLIGYVGPSLNYKYGLYLSLGHVKSELTIMTAELIEHEFVERAWNTSEAIVWEEAAELVEANITNKGQVYVCRSPDVKMKAEAGRLCGELARVFGFTDVKDRLSS